MITVRDYTITIGRFTTIYANVLIHCSHLVEIAVHSDLSPTLSTCQSLGIVAGVLQPIAASREGARKAIGDRHLTARWRTIAPATREGSVHKGALMVSSCEGARVS